MAEEMKVPPHSDEAEKSVLGSLLIDKDAIISVIEFLRPEHFYQDAHSKIYNAVLSLYEGRQPVDIITLKQRLKKQKISIYHFMCTQIWATKKQIRYSSENSFPLYFFDFLLPTLFRLPCLHRQSPRPWNRKSVVYCPPKQSNDPQEP